MSGLVLVTGQGCHLCEHARRVLAELGMPVEEIDVDDARADALAAAGVPLALLPVLVEDGRLVAYGRFSAKRLRRELAA